MAKAKVEIHQRPTALGVVGTKNPPIDADKELYRDSTAGDALVTSTWAQIKAFLKTYFDTLYGAIGLAHARLHSITSILDHTSGATPGQILQADPNGLPIDAATTNAQVAAAVALAHVRQHAITNALDHTSAAIPGKILKADANGLPIEASNTDAEVADAVAKRHTQGTDTALGVVGTKNPPIDADKELYRDSTAGDALVTSTWAQVKAFLKTYFDTIYDALGSAAAVLAALAAHIANTAVGIHGSSVAAAINTLIHRDAAGRAQIANPAVNADIDNMGARAAADAAHAASPIGVNAHDTDAFLIIYAVLANFLGVASLVDPPTNTRIKVPAFVVTQDPSSGLDVSNWYGASGAYVQSDADSDATHIQDDDANFPNSIIYSLVRWASNAAGTTNTGIGVITAVDSDTLTISKCSGADFAASYYYWIQHSEWTVPVTGFYIANIRTYWYPVEDLASFLAELVEINGTSTPTQVFIVATVASGSTEVFVPSTKVCFLTAGRRIALIARHKGTTGVPDLYSTDHCTIDVALLKQTA